MALKAVMVNLLSVEVSPIWYTNSDNFRPEFKHQSFLNTVKKDTRLDTSDHPNTELYIQNYKQKYSQPEYPPSWMVFESLSFGTVSLVLKHIRMELGKKVSKEFDLPYRNFISWIEALSYLRNLCAHHSRLSNRVYTKSPKIMKRYEAHLTDNKNIYAFLFIVSVLFRKITKESKWEKHLIDLINGFEISPEKGKDLKEKFSDPYWNSPD